MNVREAVKSRPLLLSSWRLVSRAARDRYVQGAVLLACGISAGAFFGTFVSTWVLILALPMLLISFLAARKVRQSLTIRLRVSRRRGGQVLWLEESGWVGDTRLVKKPAKVARALVDRGFVLDAVQLLDSRKLWIELSNSYLRKIWRTARDNGQIITSLRAMNLVAERTNSASDVRLRELLQAEINVMNGESIGNIDADFADLDCVDDSVLHVVGKTILDYQNGYTIRTHELCRAQVNLGFDVSVVGQMGFVETHGLDKWSQNKDGVEYLGFAGPLRNEIPLDQWLRQSVENLVTVVRKKRPAVIHAHSDFLNALIASEVAERFNVPIVYEVRGFWEETLLTNLSQRNKWRSVEDHVSRYGLPEAYTLRRQIEQRLQGRADAIVTLDAAMADQIRSGGTDGKKIVLAPNAATVPGRSDGDLQQEALKRLRANLGFPADAVIVGIASSLVPYEGVEVLIEAVSVLQKKNPNPAVGLLIVGDGVAREQWEKRSKKIGLRHTLFTGQVPNQSVHKYVALLDIAVFPRISTPVTERVQPLKPVEALGLGCSVVVSSVAPLKSLADETQLIRVFDAGDAASLATELSELVSSPTTRAALAKKGKKWARDNRSWSKNAEVYAELYKTLDNKGVSDNEYPSEANVHESHQKEASDTTLTVTGPKKGGRPLGMSNLPTKIISSDLDPGLKFTFRNEVTVSPNRLPTGESLGKYIRQLVSVEDPGGFVPESFRVVMARQTELPFEGEVPQCEVDDRVLFGGQLGGGYGHALTEGLARLWLADSFPESPIIFRSPLGQIQQDLIRFVGVKNEVLVLDKPTLFRSVVFPFPGLILGDSLNPAHAGFLGGFRGLPVEKGKKTFLGRSRLPQDGGKTQDERLLEEIFKREGFQIVFPEQLRLKDQLNEISSSEVVVGLEGSALHAVLLLQDPVATRFVAIARHRKGSGTFAHTKTIKSLTYSTLNFFANKNASYRHRDIVELDWEHLQRTVIQTRGFSTGVDALPESCDVEASQRAATYLDMVSTFQVKPVCAM